MRMLRFGVIAAGILACVSAVGRGDEGDDLKTHRSVVKIFSALHLPDPYRPWAKSSSRDAAGSGVVIAEKRILTNAHMVNFAGQISVQFDKSSEKLSATIVAVAPGIDLAVLKLDDESGFDSHPPLPTSSHLPERQQTVLVYGFPEGGMELSVTRGIVSRIEYSQYYLGIEGLRVQVDAAINPGNSGGPAVSRGQMVGIVFSKLDKADNIGYIIPMEEIALFLKDIEDGHYDGKPYLPIETQNLENAMLRSSLKLDKKNSGVLVRKVYRLDSNFPLKVGDVVAKLGEHAVDNTGMVRIEGDRAVQYLYLVQRLLCAGKLPVTVFREGREVHLDLPIDSDQRWVVRRYYEGASPYFIYGPLVFTEATNIYAQDLVRAAKGAEDGADTLSLVSSGNPIYSRMNDRSAFAGEKLVIVASPMFSHRISKGYEDPYTYPVSEVNGTQIRDLKHLVEVLRDERKDFVEITFQGRFTDKIVLNRKETIAATEEILNDNGIRQQCSPDMAKLWDISKAR